MTSFGPPGFDPSPPRAPYTWGVSGSCGTLNHCPPGRTTWSGYYDPKDGKERSFAAAPSKAADLPGAIPCDYCIAGVQSGCYPFGIGVPGALGLLAGINFLGILFTFLIPETAGKSLEELNCDMDEDTGGGEAAEEHKSDYPPCI